MFGFQPIQHLKNDMHRMHMISSSFGAAPMGNGAERFRVGEYFRIVRTYDYAVDVFGGLRGQNGPIKQRPPADGGQVLARNAFRATARRNYSDD